MTVRQTYVRECFYSAYNLFRLFVNDEFLDLAAQKTELYKAQHNVLDWQTSPDELMPFLGLLTGSRYSWRQWCVMGVNQRALDGPGPYQVRLVTASAPMV